MRICTLRWLPPMFIWAVAVLVMGDAARAAAMSVCVPWPLQPQSSSQNSPAWLSEHAQVPAVHEPAARADSMAEWSPWPLQHSVSQNSPIESPSQAQVWPSLTPWSPQLSSQNSPA